MLGGVKAGGGVLQATWRGHELHVFNRDKAGGEGHRHTTDTERVARLVTAKPAKAKSGAGSVGVTRAADRRPFVLVPERWTKRLP